jgi:putative two-component system response regulator
MRTLCDSLKNLYPKYHKILNDSFVDLICDIAPLHDIGKITIPDRILIKPDKLTVFEHNIIKQHVAAGGKIITQIIGDKLKNNRYLKYAKIMALNHHERWDGLGYPNGLSGTKIPLLGRLMTVVDVYDALISKRVYKPAFTHNKAVGIIAKDSGKAFDPEIIKAFISVEDEYRTIGEGCQ